MKKIKDLFKSRVTGSWKSILFFNIIVFLFAISFCILSVQLIPISKATDFKFEIYSTLIIVFIVGIFFGEKIIKKDLEYFKDKKGLTLIIFIFSILFLKRLMISKEEVVISLLPNDVINFFTYKWFYISFLASFILLVFIINGIISFLKDFFKSFDKWDKKAYFIVTVISTLLIIILYTLKSGWYLQYDRVFSMDSGWCFKDIVPFENYYDIRHPMFSIFSFPIWSFVSSIVDILTNSTDLGIVFKAIMLQIINAQMLIFIGFFLKKITNNKNVFIIYMLSFPTLTYLVFFEKYQLCVFLMVLYVYCVVFKKNSNPSLVFASGTMPTSGFIGILELLRKDKFKNKIINILKIVFFAVIFSFCIGRAHLFNAGLDEITHMSNMFKNETLTVQNKIYATLNLLQDSIYSVGTNFNGKAYLWTDLVNSIPYVGIIVLFVCIVGFIIKRKELISKISLIWIFFAFLLFVKIGWAAHESCLFNIYFSWAVIPLFVYGIDYFIKLFSFPSKICYYLLYIFMIVINFTTILNIYNYL